VVSSFQREKKIKKGRVPMKSGNVRKKVLRKRLAGGAGGNWDEAPGASSVERPAKNIEPGTRFRRCSRTRERSKARVQKQGRDDNLDYPRLIRLNDNHIWDELMKATGGKGAVDIFTGKHVGNVYACHGPEGGTGRTRADEENLKGWIKTPVFNVEKRAKTRRSGSVKSSITNTYY